MNRERKTDGSVWPHKAIKTLIGAGFSETKAEAMIDAMGESHDALATKADISAVKSDIAAVKADVMVVKADVMVVKADVDAVRSDLMALEQAVNERTTKADLRELELRMRLQLYAIAVVVIGVLAALELIPR